MLASANCGQVRDPALLRGNLLACMSAVDPQLSGAILQQRSSPLTTIAVAFIHSHPRDPDSRIVLVAAFPPAPLITMRAPT